MKHYIRSSTETHNYRVCFNDGNKRVYEAENIVSALNYVVYEEGYNASEIWKIEEAEDDFYSWR